MSIQEIRTRLAHFMHIPPDSTATIDECMRYVKEFVDHVRAEVGDDDSKIPHKVRLELALIYDLTEHCVMIRTLVNLKEELDVFETEVIDPAIAALEAEELRKNGVAFH